MKFSSVLSFAGYRLPLRLSVEEEADFSPPPRPVVDPSCFAVRARTPPPQPAKPPLAFALPPKKESDAEVAKEDGEVAEVVVVSKKRTGAKGLAGPAKKKPRAAAKPPKKGKKEKKEKKEEEKENVAPE